MSETPLTYVKGVGPQRAELFLSELGYSRPEQLLQHYPFRYVDRTQFHKISLIQNDQQAVQLKGVLRGMDEVGTGRARRLTATLQDDTGRIELVWFKGIRWLRSMLTVGKSYIVFGKPSRFKNVWNIAHPEIEAVSGEAEVVGGLQPVYSTTEKLSAKGLTSKGIERIIKGILSEVPMHFPENLPQAMVDSMPLMPRASAVQQVHAPRNKSLLYKARYRLKFEELFMIQLSLIRQKLINQRKLKGFVFEKVGQHFNQFYNEHLPFDLTGAQKKVLREIRRDLGSGHHMNRLLQGDVGSGKTIVAVLSMLMAIDNGFQAALMAPTEILAQQHFNGISELLKPLGLETRLLTGSTKQKERREIFEMLADQRLHVLIGTHALLEDPVQFKNLGLVIIDEQHRFGVAQRARLWKKNVQPPHILVMTATPIPRTLAMTVYGDLDVSVIDELPPGRKPITTTHRFDSARIRVFGFLEEEIAKGRQVYIVYPLIEESDAMDYKDLMDGYESIVRRFPLPTYQVSIVHGKMKPKDKDYEMQRFAKGETHIMVATTVIEVGVNVPNASVMVIESAERFGLSQLN